MFKMISQSKFIRNILLVVSGTAGAQAITFLFYPLITRLYDPESFGVLGTFTAITAVVMPIAALTYPIAIVLPKNDNNAKRIAKLSIYISLFISIVLSILIILFGKKAAEVFGIASISAFLILIPISMFFDALKQVIQQWLIRKKQFKVIARISVSQSLIVNACKAGGGLIYPSGVVLIVLTVLGNAIFAIQLWLGSLKWSNKNDAFSLKHIKNNNFKKIAVIHRDFPFYRAPETVVYFFSESVVVIALAYFYNTTVVGSFTLARLAMMAPTGLLGKAVNDVFYPKAVELYSDKNRLRNLYIKSTLGILFVAGLPFLLIIIAGPTIFEIVFGKEWFIAGEYARWVSIWMVFSLTARPAIALFPVLNVQRLFLLSQALFLILKATSLLVANELIGTALSLVALYSLASALSFIALIFLAYFSIQISRLKVSV